MAIQGKPLFTVKPKTDPNKITLSPTKLQGEESAERPPMPAPVDEVALQRGIDAGVHAGIEAAMHFMAIANQIRLLAPLNVVVFGLGADNAVYAEANGDNGASGADHLTLFVEHDEDRISRYALNPKWTHAQLLKVDLPADGALPVFPDWVKQKSWEVVVVNQFGTVERRWDGAEQKWIHDAPKARQSALRMAGELFKPGVNWAFAADYDVRQVYQWCAEYLKGDAQGVLKAKRGNPGQFQKQTGVWAGPHRRGKVRYV